MMLVMISSVALDPISMRMSPRDMDTGVGDTELYGLCKSGELRKSLKSREGVVVILVDCEEGIIPVDGVIGTISGTTESTIVSLRRCFQ